MVRLLEEQGAEVFKHYRRSYGDSKDAGRRWVGNILDPEWRKIMTWNPTPYDACVHLAWHATPGQYLHSDLNFAHAEATVDLARRLAAYGCKHFVGVGSCLEYAPHESPRLETDLASPRTVYAACKHAVRLALPRISEETGMRVSWARVFLLYGPWEPTVRLVPAVVRSLLAGQPVKLTQGKQLADFSHVGDIASGLVAIAGADTGPAATFNVCSGRAVSIEAVAREIGSQLERSDLLHFGAAPERLDDPTYLCGINEKLRSIGWRPKFDLKTGVADTIAWWRRQRAGLPLDHSEP